MAETFSCWKSEAARTPAGREARRLEAEAEETTKHSLAAHTRVAAAAIVSPIL